VLYWTQVVELEVLLDRARKEAVIANSAAAAANSSDSTRRYDRIMRIYMKFSNPFVLICRFAVIGSKLCRSSNDWSSLWRYTGSFCESE
jgi:hypothetical protein